MWFIPFLLIGVALYAAGRGRGAAEVSAPQRLLPPPPGPIAVLGELVRIGHTPPPQVILCAIAEAESIGRSDLATDIIRVFVAPFVAPATHVQQQPMSPVHEDPRTALNIVWQQRARLADPRGPVVLVDMPQGAVQERVYAPSFGVPKRQAATPTNYGRGSCDRPRLPSRSPREAVPHARTPDPRTAQVPMHPGHSSLSPSSNPLTDDQIRAALDADPERFIRDIAAHAHDLMNDPNWASNPATAHLADHPVTIPEVMDTIAQIAMSEAVHDAQAQPTDLPATAMQPSRGGFNTQPGSDWDQEFQAGHPLSSQPDVGPMGTMASPLLGVSDDAWSHFCGKLVRETPAYQSARHVGQYRQRRERLTELGIDPNSIVGSVEMQRAALDADLADAYRHAADDESGIVRDNVNRTLMLPGHGDPTTITLSGVLGVIQAAGLEGAAGWLESPRDRKKYPHTTQAFVRCNGAF